MWLVLSAAAGNCAMTMGVRQSLGHFAAPLDSLTGLGLVTSSLAFAIGQYFWATD